MITRPLASFCSFQNGVFYLDGKKVFLNSTDYPYFRDDPENWADRLKKMKSLGNDIVSFYIPWRHHEVEIEGNRRYDFHGDTLPNRDVIGFLKLCQAIGLKAIVKPGPFIHAEVNYGGLPNWVCPSLNPAIEPMIGSTGEPFTWPGIQKKPDASGMEELPLPAPFDPLFLAEVKGWLQAVTDQVIAPFVGTNCPIVMIQVANEGIYSNYQRAPWAYDFSRSSVQLYRQFLQRTYGSLRAYNLCHATQFAHWNAIDAPRKWKSPTKWERPNDLSQVLLLADWAAYQSYYMREILTRLKGWIPVDLPFVINANPATNESFGIDAWLSRVNPDDLPGIQYGFTNWIGVACKDPSVVERYQVMIKRARGANLEENWGFSELYEREFAHPSICFYQTLIQIASGATGYNIYTGVGTSHVDQDLDQMHVGVYPDLPPIDGEGQSTPKADTVKNLNKFFDRWGADFLECEPVRPIAFGLYLPYANSAVWVPEQDWKYARTLGIPNHGRTVQQFEKQCLQNHLDFDLPNLQRANERQVQRFKVLVIASGRWMDSKTQQKLKKYVLRGGRLLLVGEIPSLDERLQPAHELREIVDQIQVVSESQFFDGTAADFFERIALQQDIICLNEEARQARIWRYRHAMKDVDYLLVFSGNGVKRALELRYRVGESTHDLKLSLPSQSAGVVRIQDGKISAILAKCNNEDLKEEVPPYCAVDGDIVDSKCVGDWFYDRENDPV
nr:hypothetical protein [uncultured bacterium]